MTCDCAVSLLAVWDNLEMVAYATEKGQGEV